MCYFYSDMNNKYVQYGIFCFYWNRWNYPSSDPLHAFPFLYQAILFVIKLNIYIFLKSATYPKILHIITMWLQTLILAIFI